MPRGGGQVEQPEITKNERAGNIEGALAAKGDGQILQQRMEGERLRKQAEMARAEERKAAEAAERDARSSDVTYTRALGRAGSRADAFDAPAPRKPAAVEEPKEWWYIDASKAQQGPFTLAQMRQWYAAGYLPDSTQAKHADDAEFSTIGQQSRIYVGAPGAGQAAAQPAQRHPGPGWNAASPQQQQRHGYGQSAAGVQAAQQAHAASVAQDLARAAQQSAKAGGLGGVTKKKKGKKKLGNAVGTRATPGFAAKRTTKDLWKPGGAHTIF